MELEKSRKGDIQYLDSGEMDFVFEKEVNCQKGPSSLHNSITSIGWAVCIGAFLCFAAICTFVMFFSFVFKH